MKDVIIFLKNAWWKLIGKDKRAYHSTCITELNNRYPLIESGVIETEDAYIVDGRVIEKHKEPFTPAQLKHLDETEAEHIRILRASGRL